jgi:IS5 family transposase
VNADAKHKLIRHYEVTDASVHDSQKFAGLLNKANTSADVYADSAYRSAESRLRCPHCENRRMVVMFEPPSTWKASASF